MQARSKLKKFLIVCLILVSIVSGALIYYNSVIPPVLFSQDTIYYLPGQKNNCLWIMRLDNDIRDIPGDSSQIRIGIPIAESRGYLGGRIEVGTHKNLILAFSGSEGAIQQNLILLTADYSGMKLPIETIRFRWNRSTVITVLLFTDKERCLASRVAQ